MERKVLWPVLVLGLALVIAPFAIGLPGKAAAGQRMIDDFHPLMQPASVEKTAMYYNDVFVPLGKVAPAFNDQTVATFRGYLQGFSGMATEGQRLVPVLAQALGMTPGQVQAMLVRDFPNLAETLAALPTMRQDFDNLVGLMAANTSVFAQVPAGLDWYLPLVTTMQENVADYESINSLPSFTLFTWFFVVPGALLVLLAAFGLWGHLLSRIHLHRPHPTPV